MEKTLFSRLCYAERVGGMASVSSRVVYNDLEFGEGEGNVREKLNMMVRFCVMGYNLSSVQPPIFSNLTRLKRCLIFGNYL